MPIYHPLEGGDRRSIHPHWYGDPRDDAKRWARQQEFKPPYPWQTIEEEPDSVRAERESRDAWNATRRVFGDGFEWCSDGTVRATVEQPPITREEEKPQRRSEPEPQRAEPSELESTAGHEAAHHCLASVCGCTDIESTIAPSRSESGGIRYGHCTYWPPAGGLSLVKDLAISAAGGIWEMLEYGRYINGPDGATVARKLDKAGITDPDDRAALIEEAHAYARRNLETNRDSVRRLAQELQENVRKPKTQVRRVELPLQTRSGAATFDAKANTVEVIWGTGARVLRSGWDGRYWEDLPVENADLGFLNSGRAPFLNHHQSERVNDVLGVVQKDSAYTRDGKGYATIRLGSNAPLDDLRSGVLANVSIGYSVGKMREQPAGSDGIPVMRIESYKIKEISAVSLGADEGAQVRYECEVRS